MQETEQKDSPAFRIDADACTFESSDPAMARGNFFSVPKPPDVEVASLLPLPLNDKLIFQVSHCIYYYLEFLKNPGQFISARKAACLFDRKEQQYALTFSVEKNKTNWLFLNSNGQVLMCQTDDSEARAETEKWELITDMDNHTIRPPIQEASGVEAFEAYLKFILAHWGHYTLLYKNAQISYRDLIALHPALKRKD